MRPSSWLSLSSALAFSLCAACKTATTEKSPAPSQSSSAASAKGGVVIDPTTPVATMDGQNITYGDLEKEDKSLAPKVKKAEADFLTSVYDSRREALDNLIAKRLLEGEAKKANKPLEQWISEDFQKSLPAASEADAKAFYEEHKGEIPPGTSFDDVKDRILKVIQSQRGREALTKKIDELKSQHAVKVSMAAPELPRVEVVASGPARGPATAKVTIIEFSDFQCPFCSREVPVVDRVMKEYDGKVRLVFRQFPLDFHPMAAKAAESGLCAAEQGKFWEMHDKMFANQKALEPAKLKEYAKALGLDAGKFDKCLDSGEKKAAVDADQKAGGEAGVNGTPAFFVNGLLISGAQEFDKFKEVIDRELQR